VEKLLSEYSEDSDTKLSDFIPEQKSVIVILGFLASVGISFSWNIGAALPFLYSLGIFYVFLNLGSSLYLVKISKKDIFWIVIAVISVIFATMIPQVLKLLRGPYL